MEVVTRAVAKLNIDCPAEKQAEPQKSKLDEHFLRTKPLPPRQSLHFFCRSPHQGVEVVEKTFSARLFIPTSDYYGNVPGPGDCGYRAMPRVEQTLASYLSPSTASSLKAPVLSSKPLRTTSALVGKGYTAAGQAGACLHTMSVLQAYQADLLKELDEGKQVKSDDISELRRTADLALHAGEAFVVDPVRYEREGQGLPHGSPACAFWSVWRRRQFRHRQIPGGS